jgi:hypothetical protein
VLRHEYGNTLAFHYPKILNGWPDDACHISKYAASNTEIFKCFIKHKGKLLKKLRDHDGIVERWRTLSEMGA